MMQYIPHEYQRAAIDFLKEGSRGLFLDPGLGKTSITLSHIASTESKTLLVAPLRVIHSTWPQEIAKWDCFSHLTYVAVHGRTPSARVDLLNTDADIHAINPEGIHWLCSHLHKRGRHPEWDLLVVDESTRFKAHSARCWRSLRAVLPLFKQRIILTGTPAPNSLEDLWTQLFILDGGQSLGERITHFRTKYFFRGGYQGREYIPFPHSQSQIEQAIRGVVLRLDAKDFLDMPELLVNDILVDLPESVMRAYRRFERELLFQLDSTPDMHPKITAEVLSAGALYVMCRQIANGGMYIDSCSVPSGTVRQFDTVHRAKIEALDSLVSELSGKPVLVFYQFKHDLKRLLEWKKAPYIGSGVSPADSTKILKNWNSGQLPILYAQPKTVSHGLNMQKGGNDIVWFGLTDELETYQQANARLHRQGVEGQVRVHRILASRTVDLAMRRNLAGKSTTQETLLNALKDYRDAVDLHRLAPGTVIPTENSEVSG